MARLCIFNVKQLYITNWLFGSQKCLELPPARDAEALVVVGVAVDDQAGRAEAPNKRVISFNDFFATRISPWAIVEASLS